MSCAKCLGEGVGGRGVPGRGCLLGGGWVGALQGGIVEECGPRVVFCFVIAAGDEPGLGWVWERD